MEHPVAHQQTPWFVRVKRLPWPNAETAAKQRANPSLSERLAEILGKSAMVKICETCADAGGLVEDYLPPSAVIGATLERAK